MYVCIFIYEEGPKKTWNYLLESGYLTVQASPMR